MASKALIPQPNFSSNRISPLLISSSSNCPHEAEWTPFQILHFQKNFWGISGNLTRDLLDDRRTNHYTTGAQITILKGKASIPPSTAVTQRSLPTCSLANYVLPPCAVNSCLCTSCAVGAPVSASLCSEHVIQTSYSLRGQQ